jgi:hypothetical protein
LGQAEGRRGFRVALQIAIVGGCLVGISYILGVWVGYGWGHHKGRSSMWDYCQELKKNLEAETEAKDRARAEARSAALCFRRIIDCEHDGGDA